MTGLRSGTSSAKRSGVVVTAPIRAWAVAALTGKGRDVPAGCDPRTVARAAR